MPIHTYSVRNAADTLAGGTQAATKLARSLFDALGRAAVYRDPNLSDAGLESKRQELRAEFRAAGGNDLAALKAKLTDAGDYLRDQASTNLPYPTDTVGMMQLSNRWANVERLLDAGKDIRSILGEADVTTALAIREFGGAWVEANSFRPPTVWDAVTDWLGAAHASPNTWLDQAVNARIAQVTPDTNLAELLRAANAAPAHLATAQPYLDAVASLSAGGSADLLSVSVDSMRIAMAMSPSGPPSASAAAAA